MEKFYWRLWLECYIIQNAVIDIVSLSNHKWIFPPVYHFFFTADIYSCGARGCAGVPVPVFVIFTHLAASALHIYACVPLRVCVHVHPCVIFAELVMQNLCVATSSQGSLFSTHAYLWQITLKCHNIFKLSNFSGWLCSRWHCENSPLARITGPECPTSLKMKNQINVKTNKLKVNHRAANVSHS